MAATCDGFAREETRAWTSGPDTISGFINVYNRFDELRTLEDGLAAFGEDALPEIRNALLEGTPGNDGMVELWNSGSMHPRAKLHLLAAAARRIREL